MEIKTTFTYQSQEKCKKQQIQCVRDHTPQIFMNIKTTFIYQSQEKLKKKKVNSMFWKKEIMHHKFS